MAITQKLLQLVFYLLGVLYLSTFVAKADEIKSIGDNYTIKCPAPQEDTLGVFLHTRHEVHREVLYYFFETEKLTTHGDYRERLEVKNDNKALTIDILNLQLSDTGVYWCVCKTFPSPECRMSEAGVLLLVREKEPKNNMSPSVSSALPILMCLLCFALSG